MAERIKRRSVMEVLPYAGMTASLGLFFFAGWHLGGQEFRRSASRFAVGAALGIGSVSLKNSSKR